MREMCKKLSKPIKVTPSDGIQYIYRVCIYIRCAEIMEEVVDIIIFTYNQLKKRKISFGLE